MYSDNSYLEHWDEIGFTVYRIVLYSILQREYQLSVNKTRFWKSDMVQYFIRMHERQETEFIALKDPEMLHIQNIIMIDHKQVSNVL